MDVAVGECVCVCECVCVSGTVCLQDYSVTVVCVLHTLLFWDTNVISAAVLTHGSFQFFWVEMGNYQFLS